MKPFEFTPTFLLATVNDKFYSVPRYQRSYAWELEMVDEFWQDMERAISDDREHFMGNIVLSAESGDDTQSIVDGQQRIVTTTIFLAAIRDRFKASDDEKAAEAVGRYVGQHDIVKFEDRPRVRMNPDDNDFYFSRFVEGNPIDTKRDSHVLMEGAYDFFSKKLVDVQNGNPSTWKAHLGSIPAF